MKSLDGSNITAQLTFNDYAILYDGKADSVTVSPNGEIDVIGSKGQTGISVAVNDADFDFLTIEGTGNGDFTINVSKTELSIQGDFNNYSVSNMDRKAKESQLAINTNKDTIITVKDGKLVVSSENDDTKEDKTLPENDQKEEGLIKNPFADVPAGKWYTDAVYYCRDRGYMAGKANNKFDPNGTVTRATITQVLFAMEGKPTVKKSAGFKDVASGKWYTDSVNWAATIGIVSGYSKEKFGPNDAITRQQMAAIMYQYAKYKKYDTSANGDISKFKDASTATKYAVTPLKWAVGHGIISGTNKGLEPKGTATRAQIAVILQAFDKNIKK